MAEMDKEKILWKSKETYDDLYYEAGRLSRLIEEMDIEEESINKDDVIDLNKMPTVDNTDYNEIYSYEGKLYKKVAGEIEDRVYCYTDIFMEMVEVNNKLVQLSNTLDELQSVEESKEEDN